MRKEYITPSLKLITIETKEFFTLSGILMDIYDGSELELDFKDLFE